MNTPSAEQSLQTAIDIARQTGTFLLNTMKGEIKINSSIEKDIKLQADEASEKLIIDILTQSSPYDILSEESGYIKRNDESNYRWIVDPLDGSLNFSRGIDLFAISIALWDGNTPVLGVVYDFLHNKLYSGIVNDKATCNDEIIKVSNISEKKGSILATGFPVYTSFEKSSLEGFISNIQDFKKVRLFGSAALSIIHVAKGSIEAYTENNIAVWDVAAGLAILLAAGGAATFSEGKGPNYLNVYAHNGLIP